MYKLRVEILKTVPAVDNTGFAFFSYSKKGRMFTEKHQ